MIVRELVKCGTCGQPHTVRISMGHNEHQRHKFPCGQCNESVEVGLDIDFQNRGWRVVLGENAQPSDVDGVVINLDPNFGIHADHRNDSRHFSRLEQSAKMIRHQQAKYKELYGIDLFAEDKTSLAPRIYHRNEWKLLKKAWSLKRNGKEALAEAKFQEGIEIAYQYSEPPDNLDDWLWQFAFKIGGISGEEKFRLTMRAVEAAKKKGSNFQEFVKYFKTDLYPAHADIFYDIINQYFDNYDDFTPVYTYCSTGMKIPDDYVVISENFENVKMFYGNIFEATTSLVATFACLNNVIVGRRYDQFDQLTLSQYLKLDKANRCTAFGLNPSLIWIGNDIDPQLRNASHHGSMRFNVKDSTISYRAGKGGMGQEQVMSYTAYLIKCVQAFLSLIVLLRINILLQY